MKAKLIIKGFMLTIYLVSISKLGATAFELILQPEIAEPNLIIIIPCLFVFWIGTAHFVGLLGHTRMIGFNNAIAISLLLSPLVALIVILFSKRKSTHEYEQKMLKHMEEIAHKQNK